MTNKRIYKFTKQKKEYLRARGEKINGRDKCTRIFHRTSDSPNNFSNQPNRTIGEKTK